MTTSSSWVRPINAYWFSVHRWLTIVQVAIKILDKEKIQRQNMGAQIKKEVRTHARAGFRSRVLDY